MCMKSDPNHICGICVKLKSLLKAHYKKVNKRVALKELNFNKVQKQTYSCLLCAKSFASRHLLKEHLINHPVAASDKLKVKTEVIQDEAAESKYTPKNEEEESEFETTITHSSRGRRIKKTARKIRLPPLDQVTSIHGNSKKKRSANDLDDDLYLEDDDEDNEEMDYFMPKAVVKKEKTVRKKRRKATPKKLPKPPKPAPKIIEDSGPQTCVICNKEFPHENELHIHMLDHTNEPDGPVNCNMCHHEFKEKKYLINHLRLTHGPRAHKCDLCDFSTNYASTLKVHVERKHTKKYKATSERNPDTGMLHCHLCDEKFEMKRPLQRHMKEVHKKASQRRRRSKEQMAEDELNKPPPKRCRDKNVPCDICGRVFPVRHKMMHHRRIHTGDKPYSCEWCGRSFLEHAHLVSHLRTHTGEKPFECDFCDKKFSQKSTLQKHRLTHTRVYNHSCHLCGKQFLLKTGLLDHLNRHNDVRKFQCDRCPKAFVTSSQLKSHYRTHTGERPYKCPFCPSAFTKYSHCARHKKALHAEELKAIENDLPPKPAPNPLRPHTTIPLAESARKPVEEPKPPKPPQQALAPPPPQVPQPQDMAMQERERSMQERAAAHEKAIHERFMQERAMQERAANERAEMERQAEIERAGIDRAIMERGPPPPQPHLPPPPQPPMAQPANLQVVQPQNMAVDNKDNIQIQSQIENRIEELQMLQRQFFPPTNLYYPPPGAQF